MQVLCLDIGSLTPRPLGSLGSDLNQIGASVSLLSMGWPQAETKGVGFHGRQLSETMGVHFKVKQMPQFDGEKCDPWLNGVSQKELYYFSTTMSNYVLDLFGGWLPIK